MKTVGFKGGPTQKEYWLDSCTAKTYSNEVKEHLDKCKPDAEICILALIEDRDRPGYTRVYWVEHIGDMRRIQNWGFPIDWRFCDHDDLHDENYVWLQ